MRHVVLLVIIIVSLCSAEPVVLIDGLPPVPNPFGFDDRLALRTYLEDTFHQNDVAGRSYDELIARYRVLVTPQPPIASPPYLPPRTDEAATVKRIHRENLILQLRRQFHQDVDEALSSEALGQQLRACLSATESEERGKTAPAHSRPPPATDDTPADSASTAKPVVAAAPIKLVSIVALDCARIAKPAGVVSGLVVANNGDRLIGVCFNDNLADQLLPILSHAAGSMAATREAKTCLVLLGHGDGIHIGMGENPVNLTDHLKANREFYHVLLGTRQIDCVAILSCSRQSDSQFTAFRDGLGYYPVWRVSSWERTYQNALSGLSALQLVLGKDRDTRLRAAVFYGERQEVASLAEVGERTSTVFFAATQTATGIELTPTRRR